MAAIHRHDSPECHRAPTAPGLRTRVLRNHRWPEDKMRNTLSTPTRPGSSEGVGEQLQYGEYTVFQAYLGGRWNVIPVTGRNQRWSRHYITRDSAISEALEV
jgi:hypothetical protein